LQQHKDAGKGYNPHGGAMKGNPHKGGMLRNLHLQQA
jgi:hypothetical protein